jgi:hypothetical protein
VCLIAIGATLHYAVTASVSGVSLPTIGLILMIVGAAGVALSLIYLLTLTAGGRGAVAPEAGVERDRYREPPAY